MSRTEKKSPWAAVHCHGVMQWYTFKTCQVFGAYQELITESIYLTLIYIRRIVSWEIRQFSNNLYVTMFTPVRTIV